VTLSPPGFGAPIPDGFGCTVGEYRDWLALPAGLNRLLVLRVVQQVHGREAIGPGRRGEQRR
jgi:hypothetical protein